MILLKLLKIILPYKKWMLFGLFLFLMTLVSGIGLMSVGAFLITLAATQVPLGALQLSIVGVRFFGTSRGFFRYFERLITHNATFKLLKEYKVYFYKRIEPFAPAILHKFNSADLLRRLVCDIENLNNIYGRLLLPVISLAFLTIASLSLFYFNSSVAFIIASILLVGGIVIPLLNYWRSEKYVQKASLLQSLIAVETMDIIQGIDDINLFDQIDNSKNRLLSLGNRLKFFQKKLYLHNAISSGSVNMLFSASIISILYFLSFSAKSGTSEAIIVATFAIGSMALYEIILASSSAFQKLGPTMQSSRRVFEIIDSVDETVITNDPVIPPSYDLEFSDVCFKYSEDDLFELKNLNFIVKHKQCVFILGASGSGKSSLTNLIMSFYKPSEGTIKIGETDVQTLGQYLLPEYVGICEQKSHIFNETMIDNLCLSEINHPRSRIANALQLAKADDFIDLNFLSGERGIKLSAGQQKRLTIARTILSDAPIMIFDEPFANLDDETANELAENLISLRESKTVIIITHTLPDSFIKADKIIIMNEGQIESEGTPIEHKM